MIDPIWMAATRAYEVYCQIPPDRRWFRHSPRMQPPPAWQFTDLATKHRFYDLIRFRGVENWPGNLLPEPFQQETAHNIRRYWEKRADDAAWPGAAHEGGR